MRHSIPLLIASLVAMLAIDVGHPALALVIDAALRLGRRAAIAVPPAGALVAGWRDLSRGLPG